MFLETNQQMRWSGNQNMLTLKSMLFSISVWASTYHLKKCESRDIPQVHSSTHLLENSGNIFTLQWEIGKYPDNETSSYTHFQARKTTKSTSASRPLSEKATCLLPSRSSASGPTNPCHQQDPVRTAERWWGAFSAWPQTPGYLRTCGGDSLSYKDNCRNGSSGLRGLEGGGRNWGESMAPRKPYMSHTGFQSWY